MDDALNETFDSGKLMQMHILTAQQGPGEKDGVRTPGQLDKCSLDMLHGLPRELTEEILTVCEANRWEVVGAGTPR